MKYKRYRIFLLFVVLAMIACGDSSTGPEKKPGDELIGVWRFQDTNMFDLMADRFSRLGIAIGATPQEIEAVRNEMVKLEQSMKDSPLRIHLNADNTYWDNSGDTGTWGVDRGELLIFYESDHIDRFEYSINGDNLHLSMTKARFMDGLRQSESEPQVIVLFDILFEDNDVIRLHYQKAE